MKRYAYKKLTDPNQNDLNILGEQGWRVIGVAYGESKSEYGSSNRLVVIMEREGETFDPNAGRM